MKSIFKKIALVMALALIVTAFPVMNASAAEDPQVTASVSYYLGKTETAKLKTWNRAGMSWTFTVADESIATVDAQGYVTGLKVGKTTVDTVFTDKATGDVVATKTSTIKVLRNADYIALGDAGKDLLNIDATGNGVMELGKGENIMQYIVRTTGAPYQKGYKADDYVTAWGGNLSKITDTVVIASSDTSVITVNGGTITPVGEGTAKITIEAKTWAKGETTAKAEYTITVKNTAAVEVFDSAKLVVMDQTVLDNGLAADGKSGVIVIFELLKGDKVNDVAKDVQVMFTATRGSFGQQLMTLQDGKAYVLFQSESSTTELTAKLSATVVAAAAEDKELVGIQAAPVEIKLVPVKADEGETPAVATGAKVTAAVVEKADRITLYFNKEVSAAKFFEANGTKHFTLKIVDDVNTDDSTVDFNESDIVNVIAKEGNSKALTFILDSAKNFTDNSKFQLKEFVDTTCADAVTSSPYTGTVVEITKPALLSVTAISLKQIMLKFSEPIDPNTVSADAIAIDGVRLNGDLAPDESKWGTRPSVHPNGSFATVAMSDGTSAAGKGVYKDGTVVPNVTNTSRDTFIITLGKDKNGNQLYIPANVTHSLTIWNVTDFAGRTDATLGNKIENATLYFKAEADPSEPSYSVKVMSPEQYLVTFNVAIAKVNAQGLLVADNGADSILKLQYQKADGTWENVFAGLNGVNNDYTVTEITPDLQYLIQVKKDWTATGVFTGDAAKNNYYNYNWRVCMAANQVYNVANGLKNKEQVPGLNSDIMKDVDVTAPSAEIKWVPDQNDTSGKITMKFNEPVQIGGIRLANQGPLTPSYVESLGNGVPTLNAKVYATDRSKNQTFDCEVTGINKLNDEVTITVPALTGGKSYQVVIRGVSDDIGNTANYAYTFTVNPVGTPSTPDEFYITDMYADLEFDAFNGKNALDPNKQNAGSPEAIYVYFKSAFKEADEQGRSVLSNSNWTINGVALPNDATIIAGVVGDDTEAGKKGVTILLPAGTINNIKFTVVTVSRNVVSAKDVKYSDNKQNQGVTPFHQD